MVMDTKKNETYWNLKGFFKYIYTVVTWTIFVLLVIVGLLLIYYFISTKLYATYGEKFEPKFSVYTIVSQSMEPTINVYDVIVNTKVDNIKDVKVNDVITFISTWEITNGLTITHRVVGIKKLDDGQTCLITRGDNNTSDDQTCVKKENIIGVTKAVIPKLGKLQALLSNRLVIFILFIVAVGYLIIKNVFKILKLTKEIKEDNKSDNPKLNKAYADLKKVKKEK
jgi:signal peptidase